MQPAKTDRKRSAILTCILWVLEGILVGFGAILPGVSGGALCAAFGMYHPLIETFSAPKDGIRKYWRMKPVTRDAPGGPIGDWFCLFC